jgi:dTDP-N-acetylfucosamine:lipid II N-acetylfucosaminyltransferase
MNYHLMIDHWFINGFIGVAETVAPKLNVYIFTFSPPAKHIKTVDGTFADYGSKEMALLLSQIKSGDRLFVHWFHPPVLEFVRKLPPGVIVHLMFWGGELLSQTQELYEYNYDPITRKYLRQRDKADRQSIWRRFYSFLKNGSKPFSGVSNSTAEADIRMQFLKRVDYFCHWNELDLEIVNRTYGCNPKFKFFFYEGEIDRIVLENGVNQKNNKTVIWLGNSDTETNNHLDAIKALTPLKREDVEILCPLSYGNLTYGDFIDSRGKKIFAGKWRGLRQFIPLADYLQLQKNVDVVVMYHNRTQAGFNTFGFLKMGKKVYLKNQSTIYQFLKAHGIIVFDANDIKNLTFSELRRPLQEFQAQTNNEIIGNLFSEKKKLAAYKTLLN